MTSHDIELRDILTLARADLAEPAAELKQLYQWRYDYVSAAAKAVVAAGASLMVAVIASALHHDKTTSWWPVAIGGIGALLVLGVGSPPSTISV